MPNEDMGLRDADFIPERIAFFLCRTGSRINGVVHNSCSLFKAGVAEFTFERMGDENNFCSAFERVFLYLALGYIEADVCHDRNIRATQCMNCVRHHVVFVTMNDVGLQLSNKGTKTANGKEAMKEIFSFSPLVKGDEVHGNACVEEFDGQALVRWTDNEWFEVWRESSCHGKQAPSRSKEFNTWSQIEDFYSSRCNVHKPHADIITRGIMEQKMMKLQEKTACVVAIYKK